MNSIEQLRGHVSELLVTQCKTGKINERNLAVNGMLCYALSDCRQLPYEIPCWLVLVL